MRDTKAALRTAKVGRTGVRDMSDLLSECSFTWHRAKGGYELWQTQAAEAKIDFVFKTRDPKAGWLSYADRSEKGRLVNTAAIDFIDLGRVHIELAALEYRTHKLAVESVLPFVNKYGLPFELFQRECRLVDLIRLRNWVKVCIENAQNPRLSEEELDEASVHGHRYSTDEVRSIIAERTTMQYPINGTLVLIRDTKGLVERFMPRTLEDLIWLRVAQEFRREYVHKQCPNCGQWFKLRNDKRVLRKKACSPRCKKALQRKEARGS